jgi:plastocyanin
MRIGRVLRIGGAVALLVAGLVHLDLYFGGYRHAGSVPAFGRSILFNAIASGVIAVAVAARRGWYVRLAGILLAVGTLVAFGYTHTEHMLFGFQGDGLDPSPQAQLVLIAEAAAIVLLGATYIPSIAKRDESTNVNWLYVIGAVTAVAFIALGAYWADHYQSAAAVRTPSSVTIADFAFAPQTVTVSSGTMVTWTNSDAFGHSIVADDEFFISDALDNGATFRFTFDTAGHYDYHCGIHPEMSGTVTVSN